jgi:hypothetical protein
MYLFDFHVDLSLVSSRENNSSFVAGLHMRFESDSFKKITGIAGVDTRKQTGSKFSRYPY